MQHPLIPRRTVLWLSVVALFLPVALCVIFGTSTLLTAMGDASGGGVLLRVALGCGILWAIDLIGLVLVLAIRALDDAAGLPKDDESADLEHL
ncbi:MAG: hypothetical protein ABFC77_02345 [Thermoguttaceae bacterium]